MDERADLDLPNVIELSVVWSDQWSNILQRETFG